jgi:hypothetical protein
MQQDIADLLWGRTAFIFRNSIETRKIQEMGVDEAAIFPLRRIIAQTDKMCRIYTYKLAS